MARHRYHYAVRCCKKKFEIQKRKIVENLSNSKHFWTEIKKVNPICKTISNSIGEANGSVEISALLF